mmetsp:Transcript_23594/g.75872  ORF Transcript_23594/g.75872 Transcript_23594/m.75872 type:complete len:219 (+) Transcript_23594:14-670(+)
MGRARSRGRSPPASWSSFRSCQLAPRREGTTAAARRTSLGSRRRATAAASPQACVGRRPPRSCRSLQTRSATPAPQPWHPPQPPRCPKVPVAARTLCPRPHPSQSMQPTMRASRGRRQRRPQSQLAPPTRAPARWQSRQRVPPRLRPRPPPPTPPPPPARFAQTAPARSHLRRGPTAGAPRPGARIEQHSAAACPPALPRSRPHHAAAALRPWRPKRL